MVTNRKFLKSKTEHYALNHFFSFFFITFLRIFFLQRVFFEILKITFEILLKNLGLLFNNYALNNKIFYYIN